MNLDEYRIIFVAGSLVLILVATAPTLSLIVAFPEGERFSEFWLLGPNHMAEDYPFNVKINETYHIFVGVGNHLGSSEYYMVYVKFRNQTQPLPDIQNSKPSSLMPLYEFRGFVGDSGTWEKPLTFSILKTSLDDDSLFVNRLSINGVDFVVNASTRWDYKSKGFYYQLFFELWLYNVKSQSFQYHNRFVGIWLNMTGS